MADWYVSSPLWTALPRWNSDTAYSVGQIVRPYTTFQADNQCAYVVTVAGTSGGSEPSWNTNNNGTTSDNGITWTNVTGQSTYNWSAPAGSLSTLNVQVDVQQRVGQGDRVFIDFNHNETSTPYYTFNASRYSNYPVKFYSVDTGGSVPPVSADYIPGASFTFSDQNVIFDTANFYFGLRFSNINSVYLGNVGNGYVSFKDCIFTQNSSATNVFFLFNTFMHCVLENTQIIPATTCSAMFYSSSSCIVEWKNTANSTNGVACNQLISCGNFAFFHLTGLDLSAFTTTTTSELVQTQANQECRVLFENCYLGNALSFFGFSTGNNYNTYPIVEFVNCYSSGQNFGNQKGTIKGSLISDINTYLVGGASNGVVSYSNKILGSNQLTGPDARQTFDGFPIYFNNTSTGSSKTVIVEILAGQNLNNTDVYLEVEYLNSASAPTSTGAVPNVLTTPTPITLSSSTWNIPLISPSTLAWDSTAYVGNSVWTRSSDTVANFSGSSTPCMVFCNMPIPYVPCYFEFQNLTYTSNYGSIGLVNSQYYKLNYSNDPRNNEGNQYCSWLREDGYYYSNGNGINYLTSSGFTTLCVVRVYLDGNGGLAFAVNNDLWNISYTDSQIASGTGLQPSALFGSIFPFIDISNGSASSWKIASDAESCSYAAPGGTQNYYSNAVNNFIPQQLTTSFTPQNIGLIKATVKVTKPNSQIWYDPSITLL